jgi:hypothetical protein
LVTILTTFAILTMFAIATTLATILATFAIAATSVTILATFAILTTSVTILATFAILTASVTILATFAILTASVTILTTFTIATTLVTILAIATKLWAMSGRTQRRARRDDRRRSGQSNDCVTHGADSFVVGEAQPYEGNSTVLVALPRAALGARGGRPPWMPRNLLQWPSDPKTPAAPS